MCFGHGTIVVHKKGCAECFLSATFFYTALYDAKRKIRKERKFAMKHLLSLLIAVVMVFSLIPATAFASTETAKSAPKGSMTAYLSLSDDAGFLEDLQGEAVALRKLTVPYFDLANYGLKNFYFQCDEHDAGSLKPENADPNVYTGKVTVLHIMIYATEVLRCNVAPEDAGQGYLKEQSLMEKYFNPRGPGFAVPDKNLGNGP